jgi:hypothetical protein
VGGFDPWAGGLFFATHGFRKHRYQNTFSFDPNTRVWSDITPEHGRIPFNRCLLGGTVTKGGHLAMFGGCGSGESATYNFCVGLLQVHSLVVVACL